MFDVVWSKDTITCTLKVKPEADKLIEPTEMACRIDLKLGVTPSPAAGKALRNGMDKTFNALVERKSGNFLKDMRTKVRALGAVLQKEIDQGKGDQARASKFLKAEEADLKAMWTKWSEKLAHKLAEEALQEVVKTTKEKELKDLNVKKVKAAGKVLTVPTLALASAAVSLFTGNITGGASAILKAGSAMMKASEDLSSALNTYSNDQAAVEKDIGALAGALKTIAGRINSMDKQRKLAEMEIAKIASEQRVMAKELAAAKNLPAAERNAAIKGLRAQGEAIKNIAKGLPDTSDLKVSWKAIAGEHKKMLDAVKATGADAPKSYKNARNLADGAKEILSMLSKVEKALRR
ncbi:hypothetical protein [Actibacterium pelagium]|uniref:Uncharacterized protein n=1 Tax=Actibacterium pelagium TaxID=2029103 RepID=A0A917ACZ7_9RHOB|nr:hypothetical protein [Actibacterium pelagium]GGE43810.1 hypothetical protein GCM10011517_09350 [Actibacterium pelagium]